MRPICRAGAQPFEPSLTFAFSSSALCVWRSCRRSSRPLRPRPSRSDLPLVINDQVAGYIGVFSTSENFRRHMAASLQRVGKYRGLIQRVLKEEGVPQDLIYLAVAESGFQPTVVNGRSGAGGMWQFMTFTGVQYGLTRNGFFDYRFDPEKASRAYAKYIKALYNQFGDWYLAMAAYNWGPGNVQRAVQRTGYAAYDATRHLVRSAPAAGLEGSLQRSPERYTRRSPRDLALPCGAHRRNARYNCLGAARAGVGHRRNQRHYAGRPDGAGG